MIGLFAAVGGVAIILYLFSSATIFGGGKPGGIPGRQYPATVTRWDIVTDQDELHLQHIRPILEGDLVSDIPGLSNLRTLFIDLSDEAVYAWHMKDQPSIRGQPEYAPLEEVVAQCCQVLDIEQPPEVFIKNDGTCNAYVTGLDAPHILVVTKELWEAYRNHPDELRFVIGHELGHIKCDHVHAHSIAKFLIHLVAGDGKSTIRSKIVAPLLAMDLLHWCRAAEQSADRAGLICVGYDPFDQELHRRVAERALFRLMTGSDGELNPDAYLRELDRMEKEHRIADSLTFLTQLTRTHPFVGDRIKAIRSWSHGAEFEVLLNRGQLSGDPASLVVNTVELSNLPNTDNIPFWEGCDPVIVLACGETIYRRAQDSSRTTFSGLNWRFSCYDNARLVIDVLDVDAGGLIEERIGSAVLRIDGSGTARAALQLKDAPEGAVVPEITLHYQFE